MLSQLASLILTMFCCYIKANVAPNGFIKVTFITDKLRGFSGVPQGSLLGPLLFKSAHASTRHHHYHTGPAPSIEYRIARAVRHLGPSDGGAAVPNMSSQEEGEGGRTVLLSPWTYWTQ